MTRAFKLSQPRRTLRGRSPRYQQDRAMGLLQHRCWRVSEEKRSPRSGADAHDNQIVLPDLELPQDGLFCSGVRANRGPNRHAKSVAKSDGIAQDRFLIGANSPIWAKGGGPAAPSG